jgi:hypothetical protein
MPSTHQTAPSPRPTPATVSNDTSLRVLAIACGLAADSAPLTSSRTPRPTATDAGLRLLSRSLRAVDRQATSLRKSRAAARRIAA